MRSSRFAPLVLIALGLVLPASAGANAAVHQIGSATFYEGVEGVDDVTLTLNNPPAWIFQRGVNPEAAAMTGDAGCTDVFANGTRLACPITGTVQFDLLGGDDKVLAGEDGHAMSFDGGPGKDFISVGGGAINQIFGGEGDDSLLISSATNANTVDGGAGDDLIEFPRGPDDVHGGAGTDTVFYGGSQTPVAVSLDDAANDGKPGALANIHSDVENVTGGEEEDTFSGSAGPNALDGGDAKDSIDGGAGQDALKGGTANDTIAAHDGEADSVDCGPGEDTASVDDIDTVVNCEKVTTFDVHPKPGGSLQISLARKPLTVTRKGLASEPLTCGAAAGDACTATGTVSTVVKKRGKATPLGIGTIGGSVGGGKTAGLRVHLFSKGKKLLKRSHRLQVTLAGQATDGSGRSAAFSVSLRLRAARPRHRHASR